MLGSRLVITTRLHGKSVAASRSGHSCRCYPLTTAGRNWASGYLV